MILCEFWRMFPQIRVVLSQAWVVFTDQKWTEDLEDPLQDSQACSVCALLSFLYFAL